MPKHDITLQCHNCDAPLAWSLGDGNSICSSDYRENLGDFCYTCLIEYCQATNCLECKHSKNLKSYKDCEWFSTKIHYRKED